MADLSSFEAYLATIKADVYGFMNAQYQNIVGEKFRQETVGIYHWGPDEVDLNGVWGGNVSSTGASWAAYLYLKYVRKCRQRGVEAGPFTDEWNDEHGDDE